MLGSEPFEKALLASVKATASSFCMGMSQRDFDKRMQAFEDELAAVDAESRRWEAERRRAELEVELAALDA